VSGQTFKGKLAKGLKIGDEVHKDFELREATTQDVFDAEAQPGVHVSKPVTFAAALLCLQLLRIGTYAGPFTVKLLGSLSKSDFSKLRAAQEELDQLGEAG
jgi:phage FluMu protein gp41